MIQEAIPYLEQANNFLVNVMFCASSKHLTEFSLDGQKYLYTIFCLEIIENSSFIVFLKILQPLKRKGKQGNYFKIKENSTQSFANINQANSYVNSFIHSFSEHERSINNLFEIDDNIPAGNAILVINNWEKLVLENFNTLIKKSLKTSS